MDTLVIFSFYRDWNNLPSYDTVFNIYLSNAVHYYAGSDIGIDHA